MDWDDYWLRAKGHHRRGLYEVIAQVYRVQIISRSAAVVLSRYFHNAKGCNYLHAGCGSGGSDGRITLDQPRFHYLDLSQLALELSREQSHRLNRWYICGDIFSLPYASDTMDGIFNFGVMEHFSEDEIRKILAQFHRVLKASGRLILFWPPNFGLSVMAISSFLAVVNKFRRDPLKFYPDEISRIKSFRWVRDLMASNNFKVLRTDFGPGDLFTHVIVVAQKINPDRKS